MNPWLRQGFQPFQRTKSSTRRDGDELVVTLRVKGIKGDYAAPEDAWWNEKSLGQAKWEKPDNTSGY